MWKLSICFHLMIEPSKRARTISSIEWGHRSTHHVYIQRRIQTHPSVPAVPAVFPPNRHNPPKTRRRRPKQEEVDADDPSKMHALLLASRETPEDTHTSGNERVQGTNPAALPSLRALRLRRDGLYVCMYVS